MEKEVIRIDKNGEDVTKNISCILQIIGSTRGRASSVSTLVNNLSEGIHKLKSKYKSDNVKPVELHTKCATVLLNIQILI